MTSYKRSSRRLILVLIGLSLLWPVSVATTAQGAPGEKSAALAEVQASDPAKTIKMPGIAVPAKAMAIMPLDKVRIGAKGYGRTVFNGTKIESFPVEVISVMRDFAPKRGAIWIRCSDPRLLQSGPVQGMSGSPIFLWEEGEKQEMGKGGKLIGAFAFGYSWTHDCYAGVQPIEMMRDTGSRAKLEDPNTKSAKAPTVAGESLRAMLTFARQEGWRSDATWRADAMAKSLGIKVKSTVAGENNDEDVTQFAPTNLKVDGKPYRMMLPMTVTHSSHARWLAPLLAPMGIRPMAGPIGSQAGLPPNEIDPKKVQLEPGSVLSLPLAWGDADLNAAGTVTEVLPNGRVLGFGHAMFGQGKIALPMATGYIHFIVPRQSTSFKLGGTAVIHGSIVRDENAAVAGIPEQGFKTSPVKVTVIKDGKRKQYNYTMVQHDRLTPTLAAQVVMQSLEADTTLPMKSTVKLTGTAMFEGNRKVTLQSLMSPATGPRVMTEILPPIGSMVQNPHETMMLQSLDLEVVVKDELEVVSLIGARIEKSKVEPGEKLKVTLTVQSDGESPKKKTVFVDIPESLAAGKYPVTISDGRSYLQQLAQSRPHLLKTTNADDVHRMVNLVTAVRTDALYVVMRMPATGLAVGRQELPQLPSSRKALIRSAATTIATSYADTVEQIVPMNAVVAGRVSFQIEVQKPGTASAPVNNAN